MAITKEIVEDKIEVVGDYKNIQIRTATVIKEDDKELCLVYPAIYFSPLKSLLL